MLNNTQLKELKILAYNFIDALHSTTLDKSEDAKLKTLTTFSQFIGYCEGLLGKDLLNKYPTIPTSLISVNIMTQWIVGLVRAVRDDNVEQIDSSAKAIVQTMKGNSVCFESKKQ